MNIHRVKRIHAPEGTLKPKYKYYLNHVWSVVFIYWRAGVLNYSVTRSQCV